MTDEEIAKLVAAKLTGELFIGSRVRGLIRREWVGTVVDILPEDTHLDLRIRWDGHAVPSFESSWNVEPV